MCKENGNNSFEWLIAFIFEKVYPVWERYQGAVPDEVLSQLDEAWDWPWGTAECAMERLNRDPQIRKELHEYLYHLNSQPKK